MYVTPGDNDVNVYATEVVVSAAVAAAIGIVSRATSYVTTPGSTDQYKVAVVEVTFDKITPLIESFKVVVVANADCFEVTVFE